jgi:hypothetical protein
VSYSPQSQNSPLFAVPLAVFPITIILAFRPMRAVLAFRPQQLELIAVR